MKQMREPIKNVALAALVLISLLFSLGIWSNTPQYEATDDQPQYASNIGISDPSFYRSFESVTNPRDIVLHFGEQKHTVFVPGQPSYVEAMDLLHKSTFFETVLTNDYGEAEWRKIINELPGFQLDFDATLPAPTLGDSGLLKFNTQIDPAMQVQSIYLFHLPEEADFHALIYGGPDGRNYIARVEMPRDRMNKLLEVGRSAPAYGMFGQSIHKNFYLPLNAISLQNYALELNLETHNQSLVDSFFLDKSLTSRVLEKDGSQIVTDGSRSVRVGALDKIIEYRNLAVDRTSVRRSDGEYVVVRATNFVNEHGGFTGSVLLHELDTTSMGADKKDIHDYVFRPYQNGLPVIGDLCTIDISLYRNEVAQMRRSQYSVVKAYSDKRVEIISGPELLKLVEQSVWLDRNRITNVYLAYLIGDPRDQISSLHPVWVVEQAPDRRIGMFDATTGERLRSEEGMLYGLE
ncbi:YycH family regulatory protein [Tumebacillus permanentifrigoris]|uniref:Regulatory protein YycH of two-component signal transduction system YycFG n=1 Tax=Tumebacillus permanentifrigoris TaxID=378543 RepID=A0A316DIS2_9BACL|nr:two-component system activity regulator YycH [Tumebacillus permanentifrigoris]PWK16533.1 regulatory protein YycH of two-component signal transduction system YycFG [Tumebacillus permanentifrigoris]